MNEQNHRPGIDTITTYTGLHFAPLHPEPEDIQIADIAHALSLMTRANGHIKWFYSVAQHSLNCAREAEARGCGPSVRLACLLHDASEAYISDITRPVKKNLPAYREIEHVLQDAIYQKFGLVLSDGDHAVVADIDDALLWHEFNELMGFRMFKQEPALLSRADFAERRFKTIETQFLRLFDSIYNSLT